MNLSRLVFVAFAVLLSLSAHTQANVVYTYTGKPFDIFGGTSAHCCSVSGQFELASALLPNTSPIFTPLSFSFSDGRNTVTNENATDTFFWMFTDSTGEVTDWNNSYFSTAVGIFSSTNPVGCGTPANPCSVIDTSGDISPPTYFSRVLDSPGVWTITTSVPEPSSVLLLFLGLTILAMRGISSPRPTRH